MMNPSSGDPQVLGATAPARLIESGLELVRAELAVALARARQVAVRAFTALLATIVAAVLLQVALVVLVLSPSLLQALPGDRVYLALGLPVGLALTSTLFALLAWLRVLRDSRPGTPAADSRAPDARGPSSLVVPMRRGR
jgi:hypothetical protein